MGVPHFLGELNKDNEGNAEQISHLALAAGMWPVWVGDSTIVGSNPAPLAF